MRYCQTKINYSDPKTGGGKDQYFLFLLVPDCIFYRLFCVTTHLSYNFSKMPQNPLKIFRFIVEDRDHLLSVELGIH